MAEIGFFLRTENRTDDDDDMIRDFPHDFKSYVKNHKLLCQRGDYNIGWVFSSCERLPPPPPFSVSRSTVKRACREYNITWWSPRKRSKDNHLLSNKLVQAAVQEQIREPSQPPISDPPHKQDVATASLTKPRFTVAQDTSVVTIKAKYGDDFIRFQLPVLSGMVEFQQQVAKRLNLKGGTYRVKYQDEDNDWILIACDEDLQNYICNSISQGRNAVTMLLQSITNCPP